MRASVPPIGAQGPTLRIIDRALQGHQHTRRLQATHRRRAVPEEAALSAETQVSTDWQVMRRGNEKRPVTVRASPVNCGSVSDNQEYSVQSGIGSEWEVVPE